MKLLAIEMSRLTLLFNSTRPQGQAYLPQIAAGLVQRYSFAGPPQSFAELNANRVEFNHGLFKGSAIEAFEVYNDGIVVASRSNTDIIDEFVVDLKDWMQNEMGISTFTSRSVDKMYESSVIIEADEKILSPLTAMAGLCEDIGKMVALNTGLDVRYQPAGFTLAPDHTQISTLKPSTFRLERRFGAEFSLNQFFSFAPLKTSQHMDLLERVGRLF